MIKIGRIVLLLPVIFTGCYSLEVKEIKKEDHLVEAIRSSSEKVSSEIKRINQINLNDAKPAKSGDFSVYKSSKININYVGSVEGFAKALNKIGVKSRVIGTHPMQDYMISINASKTLELIIEDVAAQLPLDMKINVIEGEVGEVVFQYPQR